MITKADKNDAVVILHVTLQKKLSFPLRVSSVNVMQILLQLLKKCLLNFFLCVCSVNDYVKEAEWQLHNTKNYKKRES